MSNLLKKRIKKERCTVPVLVEQGPKKKRKSAKNAKLNSRFQNHTPIGRATVQKHAREKAPCTERTTVFVRHAEQSFIANHLVLSAALGPDHFVPLDV